MVVLGNKEYYKSIGEIKFEGKESDNPFAYKYPDEHQSMKYYQINYLACSRYILADRLMTRF